MPELVMVSSVEQKNALKNYVGELFRKGQYAEITQAIGMHSLLIDPQHTITVQNELYRFVLSLLKERMAQQRGKAYSAWYVSFAERLDKIVAAKEPIVDQNASEELASHRAAYGRFLSLEDFYAWALDDRRLSLGQIVKYIEKTAEPGSVG